jgi:cyclopropane-fatty-acyl-phospholipid synthase
MSQLADAAEGKFVVEDWENYGHHYSTTLQAWHDRFNANWDRIRSLKTARPFDERFRRMWNYYLMSCKAAFDVELLHLWQLVMTRRDSGRGVYRRVMRMLSPGAQPEALPEMPKKKALDAA